MQKAKGSCMFYNVLLCVTIIIMIHDHDIFFWLGSTYNETIGANCSYLYLFYKKFGVALFNHNPTNPTNPTKGIWSVAVLPSTFRTNTNPALKA